MLGFLTSVVGVVAKGGVAKAIAGGYGGAILSGLSGLGADGGIVGMLLETFGQGFVEGASPHVIKLGALAGNLVVGYAVNRMIVWIAPANKS